jgi:predicted alpha/beta-hydrolase family hydrolase
MVLTSQGGDRVPARFVDGGPGAGDTRFGIVLAHGAGAGQDHPWMVRMRNGLASAGRAVLTFDYAYIAAGRRSPDRPPRLLDVHAAAFEAMAGRVERVVLAGKSMGGRMASHLVGDRGFDAAGLVYYAYPLVPLGKGEPRPTDHLDRITVPQLFFAGTRDRLSPPPLVEEIVRRLPSAEMVIVAGADHSFRVPKQSGRSDEETMADLVATTAAWMDRVL